MATKKNDAAKLTKNDDDFLPREIIRYERYFGESIDKIKNDPDLPKTERVAYLGFLKAAREDEDLTFQDYFENLDSFETLNADAFGAQDEDEEGKDSESSAKSE